MLEDSPLARPDRVAEIKAYHHKHQKEEADKIEQTILGMWLDQFFYYNDLWSSVHYNIVETVYDPLARPHNWRPRKTYAFRDYDYEIDSVEIKTLQHYPEIGSEVFQRELQIVNAFRNRGYQQQGDKYIPNEKAYATIHQKLAAFPLTAIADKIIFLNIPESPFYVNRLPDGEIGKSDYYEFLKRYEAIWEQNGYHSVAVFDLKAEDFGDRPHLNTLGGRKLARKVATKILSLTNRAQ